jgi:uncharacterized protein
MLNKRLLIDQIQRGASLYPALLITGPRQSGKSTLCSMHFPDHKIVLLDDDNLLTLAKSDPQLFIQNFPPPVVYDEVQRAGELFLALKRAIDLDYPKRRGAFILTGSQPFTLIKSVADSLAGRIGILELMPMTCLEVHPQKELEFSFTRYLEGQFAKGVRVPIQSSIQDLLFRGGFPRMALERHSPSDADVRMLMGDYIKTYLHKDLRDLKLVRDLNEFERFLRRFALSSATIKGPSEWASDLGIPRSTAKSWSDLLCASYLAFEIPAFAAKLGNREKKTSKFCLIDSGLMSYLLSYQTSDQLLSSPVCGQIFETYAQQAFRAWLKRDGFSGMPYHWRANEKHEVDMVFEVGLGELIAVEFKMTAKPSQDDMKGIRAFQSVYPNCKRGIVVSCHDHLVELDKGILNIPISAL